MITTRNKENFAALTYYALGVEHRRVLSTKHSQENRKQSLFDIPEGSPPMRSDTRVVASPQGVTRAAHTGQSKTTGVGPGESKESHGGDFLTVNGQPL